MLSNDFLKLISFIKFWGFCFVIYVYIFFSGKFLHISSLSFLQLMLAVQKG